MAAMPADGADLDHQAANPGTPLTDTHSMLQHALCAFLTQCLHCLAV